MLERVRERKPTFTLCSLRFHAR